MIAAIVALFLCFLAVAGVVVLLVSGTVTGSPNNTDTPVGEQPAAPPPVTTPVPPKDKWTKTSVTIVGDVLRKAKSSEMSVEKAMQECHRNALCTHVDVWNADDGSATYYLKNVNKIPDECVKGTVKCADGDWKDGNNHGWFHPDRGWADKSVQVEKQIKELECSAGSDCATNKIMTITLAAVDFIDSLLMPISGAISAIGKIPAAVLHGYDAASLGLAVGDVARSTIASKLSASRSDKAVPYHNIPRMGLFDKCIDVTGSVVPMHCSGGGKYPICRPGYIEACEQKYIEKVAQYLKDKGVQDYETEAKTRTQAFRDAARARIAKFKKYDAMYPNLPEADGNFDDTNWTAAQKWYGGGSPSISLGDDDDITPYLPPNILSAASARRGARKKVKKPTRQAGMAARGRRVVRKRASTARRSQSRKRKPKKRK